MPSSVDREAGRLHGAWLTLTGLLAGLVGRPRVAFAGGALAVGLVVGCTPSAPVLPPATATPSTSAPSSSAPPTDRATSPPETDDADSAPTTPPAEAPPAAPPPAPGGGGAGGGGAGGGGAPPVAPEPRPLDRFITSCADMSTPADRLSCARGVGIEPGVPYPTGHADLPETFYVNPTTGYIAF